VGQKRRRRRRRIRRRRRRRRRLFEPSSSYIYKQIYDRDWYIRKMNMHAKTFIYLSKSYVNI